MSEPAGGLIPYRYIPAQQPAKTEQLIIVNWLAVEVPAPAAIDMELLNSLSGWRNREVFYFIRYEWPDWTKDVCP
jgi:hypothetical protein